MKNRDVATTKRAIISQSEATDVHSSIWVAASAGTGKTKVLTDRVLGLLLTGNDVQALVCITFTRAAAAEMAERIISKLSKWSFMETHELEIDIKKILGYKPSKGEISRARELFAIVLENHGRLNIETIHAFCQSLLRRFPLEADVPPYFEIMEQRDASEILFQAKEDTLAKALRTNNAHLSSALETITQHIHESTFPKLVNSIISERHRITRFLTRNGGIEATISGLRNYLRIRNEDTKAKVLMELGNPPKKRITELKSIVQLLLGGSKSDIKRAKIIHGWIEEDPKDLNKFYDYSEGFLKSTFRTGKVAIKKHLITQKLSDRYPKATKILKSEAERIVALLARLRSVTIIEATEAVLYFAEALLESYRIQKERQSLLDYDDLISKANHLLTQPGISPWVLYKLDGGIDHILIDEAQDTSMNQWQIVESLVDEFMSGQNAQDRRRSVFAVGDIKQSIYSFQGADPNLFHSIKTSFKNRLTNAGHKWRELELNTSFRSAPVILKVIDSVFSHQAANDGVSLNQKFIKHNAARKMDSGVVELWPLVEPLPKTKMTPWQPPSGRIMEDLPQRRLAKIIAQKIKFLISSGEFLESQARQVRYGDVMILVRKRDRIVDDMVRELKNLDIQVAGVDRMVLTEHIAVMDLISLGRFILLPHDDLNLASLLKSPLIGLKEKELFNIALKRTRSIWEELSSRKGEKNIYGSAYKFLCGLIKDAELLTPFELYGTILDVKGGRKKLLSRLGLEAAEPISEFLTLALRYEKHHIPSLEKFIYWIESGEIEIKRDLDQSNSNSVRITTVHGAKGLQAPIIILPDTTQVPAQLPFLYWPQDNKGEDIGFVWSPRRGMLNEILEKERELEISKRDQEYRRLLYVAMSRAQDHLYICGWSNHHSIPSNCWYKLVQNGMSSIGEKIVDAHLSGTEEPSDSTIVRVKMEPPKSVGFKVNSNTTPLECPLENWAKTVAPEEIIIPQAVTPSTIVPSSNTISPLNIDDMPSKQKGVVIHSLLQTLPELPGQTREMAARKYLSQKRHKLNSRLQTKILKETMDVLNHPEFKILFGEHSKAEVPIIGLINSEIISGRIDRLIVEKNRIIIADYKSNRQPPPNVSKIPKKYLHQMGLVEVSVGAGPYQHQLHIFLPHDQRYECYHL